ncbi:LysM peptidoglycan-binding domain-containing protein [Methylomonas sp. LL1]|uniref:LysM peptidoglycan-binding domain-containing protein n=1 Tax=Methylomonas sp. LL1 TaxID=2785785 RepID=UPI0018C3DD1C|nr:LysM peptidoglycan-binding domain-containing protein [Methylomonas sp. LL1]QPK62027.1 LysM peptidoglycan-binding domain-containing protein [Methylomonas sp. LL1]
MPRSISKKSARHLSYLLPVLLVTGCSQTAHKDPLTQGSTSKFSVFTRNHNSHLSNKKSGELKDNATIWDRMLSLYALPEIDNARIDREISFYLKNPEYLSRVQQRAEPYLYFILNEIEAKNIPGEMALLPVVESAFRPDAESPAQASGLWQFIPPTGRLYGLEQNSWYDGRRDVVESTRAATTFLKQLSEEFNNDWLLALASYNAGKGNIRHAIDKNLGQGQATDYWSLDLNSETAAYVPRLLAVAKIFANPEKYNVNLHRIANAPYFELVDVQSQIDLSKAAEMAQTPLDDFIKLNPGFNRLSTAPDGPHRLLIPVEKADGFKEKLAELAPHERIQWEHHAVGKRETLQSIAQTHHTSVEQIQEVNHLDSDEVAQGKTLLIPMSYKSSKGQSESAVASSEPQTPPPPQVSKQTYTVKKGDTLWSVSQRLSVDKDDILSWNKLSKKAALKPGQKLTIKKTGGNIQVASTAPSFKQISYTVKPGDTLAKISKKFKVNVTDIRKWNNVPKNRAEIKPGSKLKITVETGQSSS